MCLLDSPSWILCACSVLGTPTSFGWYLRMKKYINICVIVYSWLSLLLKCYIFTNWWFIKLNFFCEPRLIKIHSPPNKVKDSKTDTAAAHWQIAKSANRIKRLRITCEIKTDTKILSNDILIWSNSFKWTINICSTNNYNLKRIFCIFNRK